MPNAHRRLGLQRRSGRTTLQDALVFVVIALVVLVLIEGVVLSGATPIGQTITQVSTKTVTDPASGSASTFTLTSDGTSTVTVTTNQTATMTATATSTATQTVNQTSTSTSTSTYTTTESGTATTVTDTTIATSTTTVISVATGPFVVIAPGAATNKSSHGFTPDSLVVVIGVNNTITWINSDSAHQTVTSTSQSQPFNSGDLAPNQTFSFTFTQPGRYTYVSAYYAWMTGVIIVKS